MTNEQLALLIDVMVAELLDALWRHGDMDSVDDYVSAFEDLHAGVGELVTKWQQRAIRLRGKP